MTDEIESKDNILTKADAEILQTANKLAGEIQVDLETFTPELLSENKVEFLPPKPKGAGKGGKVLKPQLIDSICELQDKLNLENKRPRSHFERMTKVELEELLASLSNKAVNKLHGRSDEMTKKTSASEDYDKENTAPDAPEEKRTTKMINRDVENGAKALFQFNYLLVKGLEMVSSQEKVKEKLGTDLVGLGDDVIENREALEAVLAQIYEENKEMLSDYISPMNQYFMLMSTMAANRAVKNKLEYDEKKAIGV